MVAQRELEDARTAGVSAVLRARARGLAWSLWDISLAFDAERTLTGFATRLRDEVDLDSLRRELTGVVGETMQPRHVSLWLRTPEGRV